MKSLSSSLTKPAVSSREIKGFFETSRAARDDTVGHSLFALGNGQWDIPELRDLLNDIIPKSAAVLGYESERRVSCDRTSYDARERSPVGSPAHNSTSILVLFEVVTEARRSEAAKDILLAETRHRMKNLLAIVRAIATQTTVEGRSGEEHRDAFLGRFEAVMRAEDLALAGSTENDLSAIVEQVLGQPGPDRCQVDCGPPVKFKRSQVAPITVILHELVTNAGKYGALSRPEGVVHLSCRVASNTGGSGLHLHWREENGPPPVPPTHSGFGSRLIRYSAEQSLGGTVELNTSGPV